MILQSTIPFAIEENEILSICLYFSSAATSLSILIHPYRISHLYSLCSFSTHTLLTKSLPSISLSPQLTSPHSLLTPSLSSPAAVPNTPAHPTCAPTKTTYVTTIISTVTTNAPISCSSFHTTVTPTCSMPTSAPCIVPACIILETTSVGCYNSCCPTTPTITATASCTTGCRHGCGTTYTTITAKC